MSSYNCAYVREHYKVPAEVGRRVIAYGEPGVILADRGHYIGVVIDSNPKKRIRNYHTTAEVQYGEMAESLPLKEWLVLPFGHDWEDLEWNQEARDDLVRVWAATPGQAKYKAYERIYDYCYGIKSMLKFKVRSARPQASPLSSTSLAASSRPAICASPRST